MQNLEAPCQLEFTEIDQKFCKPSVTINATIWSKFWSLAVFPIVIFYDMHC
jgi:hypothetical protein